MRRDQIEGKVQVKLIGKTLTDAAGRYKDVYSLTKTTYYKAYASKPDGTIIAISNSINIDVR